VKGNTKAKEFSRFFGNLREDSDRWIPWVPVCFGSGIGFYFWLPNEPSLWIALTYLLGCFLLFAIFRRSAAFFLLFGASILFTMGFGTAQLRTITAQAPVLTNETGPTSLEGRVAKVERFENGIRILLTNPRISGLSGFETPERVRIRIRGKTVSAQPGTWVKAKAVLMPPPPPAAPRGFDFQRKLYFDQIGAIGYGMGQPEVIQTAKEAAFSSETRLASIRIYVADQIRSHLNGQVGAIAVALITGDRSGLNDNTLESIRHSGLAHLLAISGLHIGLVAGGIFIVVRSLFSFIPVLALTYSIKKWAAVCAIIGALGYALLAGASIPTQRAFLMTGLALIGVLIDRETISLRTLAWVALAILMLHPEAILGPSFQMSFAAVTALVTFYQYWRIRKSEKGERAKHRGLWGRIAYYFGGVTLTTIIASAATAPFALYHFGQVATFGMLANLIAVPLAAFWVMPWAVLSVIGVPLGVEGLPLAAMGLGIELLQETAAAFSKLPNAVFKLGAFPTSVLTLLITGGLFVCLGERYLRKAGAMVAIVSFVLLALAPKPTLLIENSGKHVAYLLGDDFQLVSKDSYGTRSGRSWLRRAGFNPKHVSDESHGMRCDRLACVANQKGKLIAYVFHEAALLEECHLADVLVSAIPVRQNCPAPRIVIDRFDLWKNGAYAIYLNDEDIKIETDQGMRGNRPWVLSNKDR